MYCVIVSAKLSRMEHFSLESEVPVSSKAALALSSWSSGSQENLGVWKTAGHADDLEEVDSSNEQQDERDEESSGGWEEEQAEEGVRGGRS